ncbi:MAG: hypothetical protein AAF541_13480 [Pseudomonadota bacterium]
MTSLALLFHLPFLAVAGPLPDPNKSCCIDEDIALAFAHYVTYSRTLPDQFPVNLAVEGLTFIGSSVGVHGRHNAAAWMTKREIQEILVETSDILVESEWRPVPDNSGLDRFFVRGFVSHDNGGIAQNQQFCRGKQGHLSVQARKTALGNILVLSHRKGQPGQDCDAVIASYKEARHFVSGLTSHLPRLALPKEVDTAGIPGSGVGGGMQDAHADIEVQTALSNLDLIDHFEPQMSKQGWQLDAHFDGSHTSGQSWYKEVDGMSLTCLVSVFSSGLTAHLRMQLQAI